MTRIGSLCIVLCLSVVCNGQDRIIPFLDYLNGALQHSAPLDDQYPRREIKDFEAPVIENIKIRSQTDQFDLSRQRYEIRFFPSTPQIRKYQNQLFENLKREYNLERESIRMVDISEHYKGWIEMYFDFLELELSKQLMPIQEDLITIESKEERDGSVDLLQVVELMQGKDNLHDRIEYLRSSCCLEQKGAVWNDDQIVSVDAIEKMMHSVQLKEVTYQGIEADQFEIEKLETEYELEKAGKERIFDFAEMSYRGPGVKPWEERVTLRVGLRLPFSGESTLDLAELEIEKLIEEEQIKQRLARAKSEFLENKAKLVASITAYRRLLMFEDRMSKYDEILRGYNPTTKKQITDLLKVKKKPIERSIEQVRAKREVYIEYINLLDDLDILSKQPFINYLSPLFEPIQLD